MIGQVIENGGTIIVAWTLLKKGCWMILILQNRGVSIEIFMDVDFAVELVCI